MDGKSKRSWLPRIIKGKGGFKVVSSKRRNLGGRYKTLKGAMKRLRQVEFFKHREI